MREPKEVLVGYLQRGREAVLWKLEGLSEREVRRPMTGTGTNLLGLVKHLASVELGYFGDCFGRPSGIALPWFGDDAEANADMFATAEESREEVIGLYHAAWAHAADTFRTLDLDSPGRVPWWGDRGSVTLQQILVHMIAETHRHAGHADILRETIDGAVGVRADSAGIEAPADWATYRARLQEIADQFPG
jgi:uncharacterized damage-inducible protein DinB